MNAIPEEDFEVLPPDAGLPSRHSLGTRLALGFAGVLAMLVAVAVVGVLGMQRIRAEMSLVASLNAQKAQQSSTLLASIGALGTRARDVNLLSSGWKSSEAAARVAQEARLFEAAADQYRSAQATLEQTIAATGADEERRLFDAVREASRVALPMLRQTVEQAVGGGTAAATTLLNEQAGPAEQRWTEQVARFVALQRQLADRASRRSSDAVDAAVAVVLGIVALAVLSGLLVAWRITRGVTRPILAAVGVAERIAGGDLMTPVAVAGRDETARLMQAIAAMQARLRELLHAIRASAGEVHAAADEVAAGNVDLSQRVDRAAGNLQEASSSLRELSAAVRQTSASAGEADSLARSAASLASRGGEAVSAAEQTMDSVRSGFETMNEIVGAIDAIAFQTNILALNAAVEAARAGDAGRSFAVVADDVRALARRCAESSQDVRALLQQNQARLSSGVGLVADAGRAVAESVAAVHRVAEHIGGISAATVQQSNGLRIVHDSVAQLEDLQGQNAALVEQTAAAATSLQYQASRLDEAIGQFALADDAA